MTRPPTRRRAACCVFGVGALLGVCAPTAFALQEGIGEPSTVEGWEARQRANREMADQAIAITGRAFSGMVNVLRQSEKTTDVVGAIADGARSFDDIGRAAEAAGQASEGAGSVMYGIGKAAEGLDLLAKAVKVMDVYNKDDGGNTRAAAVTAGVELAKWAAGNLAGGYVASAVVGAAVGTLGWAVVIPAAVAGYAADQAAEQLIQAGYEWTPDRSPGGRELVERIIESGSKEGADRQVREHLDRFSRPLELPPVPVPHLVPDALSMAPDTWTRVESRMPPPEPARLKPWAGPDRSDSPMAGDTSEVGTVPRLDTDPDAAESPWEEPDDAANADGTAGTPSPAQPAPGATVDVLKYVKPQVVQATARSSRDLSAGDIRSALVTDATLTFWNVGSLIDGHGRAEMKITSGITGAGTSDSEVLRGTFSGGPRGTFVFNSPQGPVRFSLADGREATTDDLHFEVTNPEAFKGWSREQPPQPAPQPVSPPRVSTPLPAPINVPRQIVNPQPAPAQSQVGKTGTCRICGATFTRSHNDGGLCMECAAREASRRSLEDLMKKRAPR